VRIDPVRIDPVRIDPVRIDPVRIDPVHIGSLPFVEYSTHASRIPKGIGPHSRPGRDHRALRGMG
jgi:hypothetical protein